VAESNQFKQRGQFGIGLQISDEWKEGRLEMSTTNWMETKIASAILHELLAYLYSIGVQGNIIDIF